VFCSYCDRFGDHYVKEIGVDPTSLTIESCESATLGVLLLNAYQLPENCNTMGVNPATAIWTSSNEIVATVDKGIVTGWQPGVAIVGVSDEGACISGSVPVTVNSPGDCLSEQKEDVVYRGITAFFACGTCQNEAVNYCSPDSVSYDACHYTVEWTIYSGGPVSIELLVDPDGEVIYGYLAGLAYTPYLYKLTTGISCCPEECVGSVECNLQAPPGDGSPEGKWVLDATGQAGYEPCRTFHITFEYPGLTLTGIVRETSIRGRLTFAAPMCPPARPETAASADVTLTRVSGSSGSNRVGGASAQVPLRR
jgi:hypothetical protein